mgnify:FL=1
MNPKILKYTTEHYPAQSGTCSLTIVLVEGGIGDYAAYIGQGNPDWVARSGQKLLFGDACRYFHLSRELYRD